ncbi:branched-chain amino acid transport protein AzlD [Clostridia bacterium]|nr:branched-chain amino acid transport protein AzlD [Clostridia bacterium]
MTTAEALITVAIIAAATLLTRSLAFVLFPGGRKTPAFVARLGKLLPYAITGMLIVYCFKEVSLAAAPHGLPELMGVTVVAALYLWRRNTLLATVGGTLFYMALMQWVFAG